MACSIMSSPNYSRRSPSITYHASRPTARRFLLLLALGAMLLSRAAMADTVVVFNEIMYHPATNEPNMEWIELHNQEAVDVDISGWSITGGINYSFASNTIVKGRGFLVLAS